MEGPKMSQSSKPTRWPSRASETARLAATVLLPTPPLPLDTAMMFFTPGNKSGSSGRGACKVFVFISTVTSFDTYAWMAASHAFTILLRKGFVGLSNIREKLTCIPLMRRSSSTISISTTFLPVPGYRTVASASIISLGYNSIVRD